MSFRPFCAFSKVLYPNSELIPLAGDLTACSFRALVMAEIHRIIIRARRSARLLRDRVKIRSTADRIRGTYARTNQNHHSARTCARVDA